MPLGFDTTLVFSIEQFPLRIFPAIDPAQFTSRLATSETGERARQQLRQAASLREWFNQPLFVAEDYTGTAGDWTEPTTANRNSPNDCLNTIRGGLRSDPYRRLRNCS